MVLLNDNNFMFIRILNKYYFRLVKSTETIVFIQFILIILGEIKARH